MERRCTVIIKLSVLKDRPFMVSRISWDSHQAILKTRSVVQQYSVAKKPAMKSLKPV